MIATANSMRRECRTQGTSLPPGSGLGRQTRWVIVPPGLRRPVCSVTNRPLEADRVTDRELLVPAPTRSVVVLPGQRATVALLTKRPDDADRFTDLAMVTSEGDRDLLRFPRLHIRVRYGKRVLH